jgi:hypothetical protein
MTKEEMLEKLETEIRRYAKRQMTWFKRDERIQWFSLEEKEGVLIDVYPNPAKDFIELEAQADIRHLTWLNLQGQVLQRIPEPDLKQDITNLKSGLYFLVVHFDDDTHTSLKVRIE